MVGILGKGDLRGQFYRGAINSLKILIWFVRNDKFFKKFQLNSAEQIQRI